MRSLQSVLDELQEEQHAPMAALLDVIGQQEWAAALCFDLSMLRLWVARHDAAAAEVMVVYGDGRGGGRPTQPYVDTFETTFLGGLDASNVRIGTRDATVETLRRWLESRSLIHTPPG